MSERVQLKMHTSDVLPCKMAELCWVFIDQPGKADLNGKMRLVASIRTKSDSDECKALEGAIRDFWNEHKPKGAKLKSLGFKPEKVKTDEVDENNEPVFKETGFTLFNFWTGTHYKDGKARTIDIHNAKGNKVSLGGKKIGNGSLGSIAFTAEIYDSGPSARGVTLFLGAIQLTKFVEFSQDANFASQDEEDGFMGVDDEFEGEPAAEEASGTAKPHI